MQMDGLAAALSMTYSDKETLSSRWFIYLSQIVKLSTLLAIGFVMSTLPRKRGQKTIEVTWGARFDFYNQVPSALLIYGTLRLLVEIHSSWQALSWTRTINDLEHQNCHTMTDRIARVLHVPSDSGTRSRTDSRASILERQAPMGATSASEDEEIQELPTAIIVRRAATLGGLYRNGATALTELDLHEIYRSWPGTVFSTFVEQFAFSASALLSAEIVVAQITVKDALSWGQTAAMFTCSAGILHWLYVQARNLRKSGLISRERYPATNLAQHLGATCSTMVTIGARRFRSVDFLRMDPLALIAELECRDEDETTPLIRATKAGNYGSVDILLSQPSSQLNLRDDTKSTALLWAARLGHTQIVRRLLKQQKIALNLQDDEGRTPVSWAVINDHEEIVEELLDSPDTHINLRDRQGQTPLSLAASNRNHSMIIGLLRSGRAKLGRSDNRNWTPADWTIALGHHLYTYGLIKMLLMSTPWKRNVNRVAGLYPRRKSDSHIALAIPMLVANCFGAPTTMLTHVMRITRCFEGHARRRGIMLQSASFYEDDPLAETLVRSGAHVDGNPNQDLTPFQWATWHNDYALARSLLFEHALCHHSVLQILIDHMDRRTRSNLRSSRR
jgi:hypothetical protein